MTKLEQRTLARAIRAKANLSYVRPLDANSREALKTAQTNLDELIAELEGLE